MNFIDDFITEAKELISTGGAAYKYIGLYNRIKSYVGQMPVKKGLIISNENFDYLAPYLTIRSFVDAEPTIFGCADYGQLEAEYFRRENLSNAHLDVCVQIGEISTLTSSINDLSVSDSDASQAVVDRYVGLVEKFTQISDLVLVANFPMSKTVFGGCGSNSKQSIGRRTLLSNVLLEQVCNDIPGCQVVDLFTLAADIGMKSWFNHRDWYTARVPGGAKYGVEISSLFGPYLRQKSGVVKKVLAIDFDNTLWGGVAGEDGIEGIKIGGVYPGNVYEDVQRHIKGLKDRGIILVAVSKNNCTDVEPIFTSRPEMLLTLDDFAVLKVNWNEKSSNLCDAAQELNLGIDSFVFIDDNPLELDKVKSLGLGVECIRVPEPSEGFGNFYDNLYSFFPLVNITEEDKLRTAMYSVDSKRSALLNTSGSLDEYIRSIELEITGTLGDETTLDRIVQLHQKTNQFNVTTRRYDAKNIRSFISDDNKKVYVFSLRDKFGDLGIIATAVISLDSNNGEATIDSLLMSCRAMGRKVEYSFLSLIILNLRESGFKHVLGEFALTPKNGPASNFYDDFGFELIKSKSSENVKFYRLKTNGFSAQNFIDDLGVKVSGSI